MAATAGILTGLNVTSLDALYPQLFCNLNLTLNVDKLFGTDKIIRFKYCPVPLI